MSRYIDECKKVTELKENMVFHVRKKTNKQNKQGPRKRVTRNKNDDHLIIVVQTADRDEAKVIMRELAAAIHFVNRRREKKLSYECHF